MNESYIFLGALSRPTPAERAAYLDAACAGDAGLRADVEALLRAHETDPEFLEQPVDRDTTIDFPRPAGRSPAAEAARPGLVLADRYTLVEPIGEGGMGAVWQARQTEPVRRAVAVKLIKAGMDSRSVLARFEAERQALAVMDHPNIAKVHDGGLTPEGRPFFVMELVDGTPITRYCDDHRLTIRRRLELFVSVCLAVQHAHQKGVIHRDLKPSNVLVAEVDGRPVPKVIDFGVAKAAGPELTTESVHTGLGTLIGTPEYMSPEQASFDHPDVDTRSDVYALGVLLYELLAGTPPIIRTGADGPGLLETFRVIREDEPARPSARLSTATGLPALAARRGTDPARLPRLVRGDLDWIVMKCLEKDRSRRYETAAGLAADVRRFLADEVVEARPPGAGYRVRKFARRNRRALTTAALAGAALAAALAVMAGSIGWAARDRAARAAEADREAEREMGEADRLRDRGDTPGARAAGARAERLLPDGGRPDQRDRLARLVADLDTIDRLDAIRQRMLLGVDKNFEIDAAFTAAFRDYGIDMTTLDAAAASRLVRASAIRERLVDALDDWGSAWIETRFTKRINKLPDFRKLPDIVKRALVQNKGAAAGPNPPPAAPKRHPGESILSAVAQQADPDDWRNRVRVPTVVNDPEALAELAGQAERAERRPSSALLLARVLVVAGLSDRALDVLAATQHRSPTDLGLNLELARQLQRCSPPRLDEAAGYVRAALARHPDNADLHVRLGDLQTQAGQPARAVVAYRSAVALRPADRKTLHTLADGLRAVGDWDGSIASYSDALARGDTAPEVWYGRAESYARQGRWTEATSDLAAAVQMRPRYGAARLPLAAGLLALNDLPGYRQTCAEALGRVPAQKQLYGDYLTIVACGLAPDAVEDTSTLVRLATTFARDNPNAWALNALGLAHYRAGSFHRAIDQLTKSRTVDAQWDELTCQNGFVLAMAHERRGDHPKAIAEFRTTAERFDRAVRAARPPNTFPANFHAWLVAHRLRAEAEATVLGSAEKPSEKQ